ncbi:putative repeat protein (TIGR01451 family) [Paeniglutamicibacter kerguelensis]|uniref:Repeat protein (TIGR01451 family) n=2 Tax=Paeniglutamicibacter kerguelensis TaxID=254788 RepID=A0ABS4XFY2_9MICC|nr:putative repeat protein (TIGR01451 family) [Paeniglutamicibacter kerguelensis]
MGMTLRKELIGPATLAPGGEVTYKFHVGCASITDSCVGAVLTDVLPAPLVMSDKNIEYFGFKAKTVEKISPNGTELELKFQESDDDTGGKVGLNAGTDYTVTIVAKLPANTPADLDKTELTNSATIKSDQGEASDDSEPVELNIPVLPGASISKDWAEPKLLQNSGTDNTLTLGGIKNTSKVGATSLTILEPSGGTDPFASVAFTGFGNIAFPEGADILNVTYFVGSGDVNGILATPGSPNAPPAFPAGLDLSTITGFKFVFSSSKSTAEKGGIVANGTVGSVKLNTELRDGAAPGTVNNEVSITAETLKGNSKNPFTDDASFEIEKIDYKVTAHKKFAPKTVVAEDPTKPGLAQNHSTVSIGATNDSNKPLGTLTIKEPSNGTAPFGAGIDFNKFVSSPWPAGALTGGITVGSTRYELKNTAGMIEFPADLLAKVATDGIKSFEVSFEGTFAPQQGIELKFDVIGTSAGSHTNEITAGGASPEGTVADPKTVDDTLVVEAPKEKFNGSKSFFPDRVEGLVGDTTSATLNTSVHTDSNVDVRNIVQTDIFGSNMMLDWKPTHIKVTETQGADSVLVEYMDALGAWQTLPGLEGTLPGDSKGVRITYTLLNGAFVDNKNVSTVVDFELENGPVVNTKTWANVLVNPDREEHEGTVTVDTGIQLKTGKSWTSDRIVQKPSDLNPTSALKLWAENTSTYAVDSLKLTDPTGGTKPFDYVDITGMSAKLSLLGAESQEMEPLARLVLHMEDGSKRAPLVGGDALNPGLVAGIEWNKVVGFDFYLETTAGKMVPRYARFDLTVDTKLRTHLRGSAPAMLIDDALASLTPAYVIPNNASSSIVRGADTVSKDAPATLNVVTENSVTIEPELTKSFYPAGPTTFFPANGVPTPIEVTLGLTTGENADMVYLEDTDPTFWNAFDFVSWTALDSGPEAAKLNYEFLTGAAFETVAGKVQVTGGTWSSVTDERVKIDSLTDAHSSIPMTGIQGFRIRVTAEDFSELDRANHELKFTVLPRYTLRTGEPNSIDGKSANPGETGKSTVENTATAKVERLGQNHVVPPASKDYEFLPGAPGAGIEKTNDAAGGQISAGRDIKYTITVKNSGTEAILQPKITDLLPTDAKGPLLVLDEDWTSQFGYTFSPKFTGAPVGSKMPTNRDGVTAALNGTNEVAFSFPAGAKLYPGESIVIELPATVRPGAPAKGDLNNKATVNGGNSTGVADDSELKLIEGQAYASRKLVREVPSPGQTTPTGVHNALTGVKNDPTCHEFAGGFYRYPCVVETKPGGTAEWKLSVTNTGNVPSQHLEILDVFPFVGDTGVTSTQAGKPRESKWSPTLLDIALPDVPMGATREIHYLTGDPAKCKPTGTTPSDPWAGCDDKDIWTTERPANPRLIHGLKLVIDFPKDSAGLQPGDSIELSFKTQSDTELPVGSGDLAAAWNSFGYAANALVDGKVDYRSQEPIKTGITFKPVAAAKVSVGDYVWVDTNKDGRQDASEPKIKDVVLKLVGSDGKTPVTDVYGNEVLPVMTDGNGKYIFEHLPVLKNGESYTVIIDQVASKKPLAPYSPTKSGQGNSEGDSSSWTASTDNKDADLTQDGTHDPTLDFGFIEAKVFVGDYVWVDSNRDGRQDVGEKGIEGVVLELRDPEGTVIGTTTTDADGKYLFENLPVLRDGETYTVTIDKDASAAALKPYVPTKPGAGDREGDSSEWTVSTDPNSDVLTKDGGEDLTLDFGFVEKSVSVGDFVWIDTDLDGRQDPGEPGIPGVVLDLYGPDGKLIGSTTTDKDGKYTFDHLPVLTGNQKYTVKIDKDKAENVKALKAYVPTVSGTGDRIGDSSTWEASTDPIANPLTENDQRDPTLDFGFVPGKVSVGDYVWVDSNGDGRQDNGEPGIPGVVVDLYGPDGKRIGSTTTDKDGKYNFADLPVLKDGESYTVKIDAEKSKDALWTYVPTTPGQGGRDKDSSTGEASTDNKAIDLTMAGAHDPTLDFGFVEAKVSVGDYVWVDSNRDGRQGGGEPGIPGVVLDLYGPDGKFIASTTTDKDGKYDFSDLPVLKDGQSYSVKINQKKSAEALKPYVPTESGAGDREGDSSNWSAKSQCLTKDGDRDPTLDFGFVLPMVSVGDYVWVDTDGDGRQEQGEPGIPGVVLELTGPDGKPVTDINGKPVGPATTDKDGKYSFGNLPVLKDGQSYTVTINQEKSADALWPYVPTQSGQGDREGDSSKWTAKSEGLTKNGDRDPTLDFGFVPGKVSVGDRVWVDSNDNGIQDKGEPGIKDVVLDLYGPDGKKIGSTTTDKNGNYVFTDLPVLKDGQSYVVKIDRKKSKKALAPYLPTVETDGNREKDSSTWEAPSEGLTRDGESDLTLDFGFVLEEDDPELPATNDGEEGNNGEGTGSESGNGDGSANGSDSDEKPVKKPNGDKLAATGFAVLGVLAGGLLLILGGVALVRRRTRSNEG